ncbi:MAG: hypothetical protein ACI4UU_03790 [Clostridia bacterium]
MIQLRKFIKVSYDSHESAKKALDSAQAKFSSNAIPSRNFNRVENNSVLFESSGSARDIQVKDFLLSLGGALPENCHVS